jgi:hypothetical protein
MEDPMGKKRRYRKFPHKFGRKYGLKYGLNKTTEVTEEVAIQATPLEPEAIAVASPEPMTKKSVTLKQAKSIEVPKVDPIINAVKKTPNSRKSVAVKKKTTEKDVGTRTKTRRKRTTTAKTTS